jgi:hypothetical protein
MASAWREWGKTIQPSVRIVIILARIQTTHLSNTSQKEYYFMPEG